MKPLCPFLVAIFLCVANTAKFVSAQSLPDSSSITLKPGDALRIVVWQRAELSGDFNITAEGRIAHPLLQELVVLGRDFEEVRREIFDYLGRLQNQPQAVIAPLRRIGIGGEVVSPGVVAIDPRKRLLDAISLAGGPTDQARFKNVRLIRGGDDERVSLWGTGAAEETLLSLKLQSGDQVIIPQRRSVWKDYVMPALAIVTPILTLWNLVLQIS